MAVRELTAILAIVTITLGCSGVLAILIAAVSVHRPRGKGWPHFLARVVRLTFAIAALAMAVQVAVIGWDLLAG